MNPRTIWVIYKRELGALFGSPIAYIVAVFFLFITGFSFQFAVNILNGRPAENTVMQVFFLLFFSWFANIFIAPVLTMRSFSEEYRMGTFEGLMTAPVRDWEVVLAKFKALLTFYVALWAPTALYQLIFKLVTVSNAPIASGPVWCQYLIVFLMGMFYLSIGLLASSLTRNQIIAAVVSFAAVAILFFCGFINYLNPPQAIRNFVEYISVYDHMEQAAQGLISTRILVFYYSMTAMMLFITQQVLESRRWKA